MKKALQYLLSSFFLTWLLASHAYAAVSLELTQGYDKAIPIAIVPFAGAKQAPQNVSQIIKTDLQNSGHFKIMPNKQMQQLPTSPVGVDYAYWRDQDINDLIIGNIQVLGHDRYRVSFSLLDVFHGTQQKTPANTSNILYSKAFTVSGLQLRALAHRISDIIYQQLTGQKGVFSTKIAYVLVEKPDSKSPTYHLMVADVDGFNAKPLLTSKQPIMSPAWSPDAQSIAYVSFEHNKAQIYIQDVFSGQRKLVSNYPGINGAPAFSPDGKQLALVLTTSGNPNIFILNLQNQQLRQLTNTAAIDTEPKWAPDGKSIIFTSNRGGSPQIYQINIASGKTKRLSFKGPYNASASFTPNGKDIVMLHESNGQFNIAVMDVETGIITNLTQSGKDESPSVAPNGNMVLYGARANNQGILSIVSLDDRVKLRIPSHQGSVQEPAWSPFRITDDG